MELQNVTEAPSAVHGRWYGDACGTAFGLELLGERWSLLVVRELMFGPRRFSDLRAHLPGISAKVLTERLASLEANGVVVRTMVPEPTPAQLYGLTTWGYAAEPIIQELGRWAAMSPLHDPTLPLSPVSFMLSLRTMLNKKASGEMELLVVFAIGSACFSGRLSNGELAIERGEISSSDLRFEAATAPALAALFYGDAPPETVGVQVTGDADRAQSFLALFSLPCSPKP